MRLLSLRRVTILVSGVLLLASVSGCEWFRLFAVPQEPVARAVEEYQGEISATDG
jgi:hypothetical protein